MADELSRMDDKSGGLGKWDEKKQKVNTTVYAADVRGALYSCLLTLGDAFDSVTKDPAPSGDATAKLGTARLGVTKLGQQ